MDFSKVYWNTRLSTTHAQLVSTFLPGQYIADVMGGIGPFAIPAGKGVGLAKLDESDEQAEDHCINCAVVANDLNPESFKWLQHNIKKNKVVLASSFYGAIASDY